LVVLGIWPLWSLLVLITLPLAWKNVRVMFSVHPVQEQDIPTLDKESAQLQMTFGLLLALSFVI
jgi:1,4-dihydroxy-2-naphthoate octaprenyltransferase